LTAADTDVNSIQTRVGGKCPAGSAIMAIASNGKVTCGSNDSGARTAGKVSSGIWYRVAANKNGYANAVVTLGDASYGSRVRFRVGIAAGSGGSYMTAHLLEHSRSTRVYTAIRIAEGSASQPVYIDVKAERTATTWVSLSGNDGNSLFAPVAFQLLGTSPKYPSGYSAREYSLLNKASWGDTANRVIIDRSNQLGLGGQPSYPLHVTTTKSKNWQARFTNGSRNVYLAHHSGHGIHVNTGTTSSSYDGLQLHNGKDYTLRVRNDGNMYAGKGRHIRDPNGGWVRTYDATGWYNGTYGGGMYQTDKDHVRVYGGKRFRVDNYLGVGSNPGHPLDVDQQFTNNWQARFVNGSSTVLLAHQGGYGIHVNTKSTSSSRYGMEIHNGKRSIFYVRNDGRVAVNANTGSLGYNFQVTGSTYLAGDVYGGASHRATRLRSSYGYVDIGATNSSYLHVTTDRSKFYFNKRIYVDENIISSYDGDFYLQKQGSHRLRLHSSGAHVYGTLTADAFKIGSNHLAKGNQSCSTGQALYGFDKNGNKLCRPSAGVVYTAWGRTSCPYGSTVYWGYVGGSHYTHGGSGSNYQCLRRDPSRLQVHSGNNDGALIYGTEFETNALGYSNSNTRYDHDYEATCSVCYVDHKSTVFMQPGHTTCPSGFSRAYYGNLMSERHNHTGRMEYICVYYAPHSTGSKSNHNGALLYYVEAEWGALPCSSSSSTYTQNYELSCAVCLR